jgi:dienelactone hydrolase
VVTAPPIVLPMPSIAPAVWDARGTVVSKEPIVGVQSVLSDQMGEGRHALYRSVSGITGEGTVVSGSMFVPKGVPPPGGWPVISLAHGFTGLNTDCAPSDRPDFRGYGPAIGSMLSDGVAVAFTDYQGLGGPGLHPFLEPRTAGFNVIDAVRALTALFPTVSTRWVAVGISQGGQASWAANELNPSYGNGLELLGTVSMAPATNMSDFARLADREALTPEQLSIMPAVVVGAERSYPPAAIDRLLHGEATKERDAVIGCGTDADAARAQIRPADVKPASEADSRALTDSLLKMALPTERISAPMLVVNGLADQLIRPEWISASVERACHLGGQIEHREVMNAGHGDIVPDRKTASWVDDRIAGKPARTNCPGSS